MKKYLLLALSLQSLYISVCGQTVIVGNIDPSPKDLSATLEVQKPIKSKINIRSASPMDTAWIQLSNRNAVEQGTDFNMVAIRESGLYFNTRSDLASYTNDSLFTMRRSGNIGIGTREPTTKLDVVGTIRIRDGNQGNGKILESDANGVASWQNKTFGFAATGSFPAISNTQTIPNAVSTQLNVSNRKEYDGTGMYNNTTGVVTISEAGVYHIDASINYSRANYGTYNLKLVNSVGSPLRIATQRVSSTSFPDDLQLTISSDIYCVAGQTLRLFTEQNSGSSERVFGGAYSWFNLHKLY